jgi:hypothetical protein
MTEASTVRGFSGTPPRTTGQRKADVLALLERERHAWVSTSGAHGPHLVPLGCAWDGQRLVMATHRDNRTVRNLQANAIARVALGTVTDVVLIDGETEVLAGPDATHCDPAVLAKLPMDPRRGGDRVFLLLTPVRILTWRHRGELTDRTVMRHGQWLA